VTYIKAFFIAIHCTFIAILTIIVSPVDRNGKIVHFLSKVFSKGILLIAGVKVEAEGLEKFDHLKSYIFVSNHLSYFDIPILMSVIPNNLRFIYKRSLSRIPVFGWGMYLGGYIPIDRENVREAITSLTKAAEKLNKGYSISIFPEGTRSPDGKLQEFKRGMFVLAERSDAPIVPVAISGSDKIMPKKKFRINPGKVKVIFHSPVEYKKEKEFINDLHDIILKSLDDNTI
jgi:1-acyl-sn-glycerol-3-phosphate acyltransferase